MASGSKLRDRRQRHDRFFQQARAEGYAARSVYKLEELDQRFRLLRPGQRVLDLGCRPGSWLQYAARKVGARGFVVGVDRLELSEPPPPNSAVILADLLELPDQRLLEALPGPPPTGEPFAVVLSDMAPDTTGVAFTDQVRSVDLFLGALQVAERLGAPGGSFVGKIFMGEGFDGALKRARELYGKVKVARPEATRRSSMEQYVVGLGKRG